MLSVHVQAKNYETLETTKFNTMNDYNYTLPDDYAIQFFNFHREQIMKSAKETYRKIITAPNVDRFADFGTISPSADAIGQILGIMFAGDDWRAVAICNAIATNEKLRDKIYLEISEAYNAFFNKRK